MNVPVNVVPFVISATGVMNFIPPAKRNSAASRLCVIQRLMFAGFEGLVGARIVVSSDRGVGEGAGPDRPALASLYHHVEAAPSKSTRPRKRISRACDRLFSGAERARCQPGCCAF